MRRPERRPGARGGKGEDILIVLSPSSHGIRPGAERAKGIGGAQWTYVEDFAAGG